ncbi:MAG: alpha,alpha-phosphotrehalase [Gemmiger sp.]|nr:alpha,alpha-phosphotrehalase [Gemmiger sp.]
MNGAFQKSTVYQIYPKSFLDTTGSGQGDLPGVTAKLDYLRWLGVDYLWLTPFFTSPQKDNGYDVADYYAIDPAYGTMADFDTLLAEATRRGMGVMLDMVFNHTSTAHRWFQKALTGDPDAMNFYIFRDGRGKDGLLPPTNWQSKFGGSAWAYLPGLKKWYLHLFDESQADLNWENPAVREALAEVLRFWKAKGVSGFRFDVVNLISKPQLFADSDTDDGRHYYTDGPHVHEYLQELVQRGGIADLLTVGEMSSTSIENCILYTAPARRELAMCFNFHHLKVDYQDGDKWSLMPFDFDALQTLLFDWQRGMQNGDGWNAVFWCNHDQPRIVSRFGDPVRYPKESAKMLATAIHCLRGTPFIYQGEELGMTNAGFTAIGQYVDVESLNYYHILLRQGQTPPQALAVLAARSRDNARTPMQWTAGEQAGFTTGTPWLGVNPNCATLNVESEMADPDSVLWYYRTLVALRKEYPVLAAGDITPLPAVGKGVLAYQRHLGPQCVTVLCNFYPNTVEIALPILPARPGTTRLLLSNLPGAASGPALPTALRPYEAQVLLSETAKAP